MTPETSVSNNDLLQRLNYILSHQLTFLHQYLHVLSLEIDCNKVSFVKKVFLEEQPYRQ